MDDKLLLEAISQMMDEKLAQARQDITVQTAEQIQTARQELSSQTAEQIQTARQELSSQTADQLQAVKAELTAQIQAAKKEIARDTVTLMDAEFKGKFDLLAEEINALREGAADPSRLEQMQELLDMHHALLRQHTRDIQQLKKAN